MQPDPKPLPPEFNQCQLGKIVPMPEPDFLEDDDRALLDFRPTLSRDSIKIWDLPDSDAGNAHFFLRHFRDIIRFIPERDKWMIFHDQRWTCDETGRLPAWMQLLSVQQLQLVDELKKELVQKMAAEMLSNEELPQGQKKLTPKIIERQVAIARQRAESLGDEKTIALALQAASRDGSLIIPVMQWDTDKWLVGVRNGVVNLKTRTFRPGLPSDLVTHRLNVRFDPSATCPEWEKFIARVLPDFEVSKYLQRICGYSLTGVMDDEKFYFCYGSGKNGKSIFIMVMAWLFGSYAAKARNNLIEESRAGGEPKGDIAKLPGIRFLHGEEIRQGAKLREDVVKGITSGDKLTGEAKYQDPFDFMPTTKMFLMGNHKPRITGTDTGIWRRVSLIPFLETISEAEAVPQSVLMDRFRAEAPGILNWLLRGLDGYSGGPIAMPRAVAVAVKEYKDGEDDLGDFLLECTRDSDVARIGKSELYLAYQAWAKSNGISCQLTSKQLTRQLGERPGWRQDNGRRAWVDKVMVS